MNTKNRATNTVKTLTVSIVVILVVGFGLYFMGVFKSTPTAKQNTPTPPTAEQVASREQAEQQAKSDYIEGKGGGAVNAQPAPVPENSDTIKLTVSDVQSGQVTIVTELYGYAGGECQLAITNGNKQYSKAVKIIYQPQASTCAGFTVPYDSLGNGEWVITLTATPAGGSPVVKQIKEIR